MVIYEYISYYKNVEKNLIKYDDQRKNHFQKLFIK